MCSSKSKLYWGNLFFKSNSGYALNPPCSRICFELLDLKRNHELYPSLYTEGEDQGNEMGCIDEKRLSLFNIFT